ncbi:MAG: flagellar basal body P-ring protein FlgI [Armatimonadetes bacterium]|nr:flagellar basal body P-ring protein FlgI [Armatimonadota bacterium]
MKRILLLLCCAVTSLAMAQAPGSPPKVQPTPKPTPAPQNGGPQNSRDKQLDLEKSRDGRILDAERNGVEARLKEIARFRGIRSNTLQGIGLVVGLQGTGDTRRSVVTQSIVANLFRDYGINIDANQIDMQNVAAVFVTADLPAFATNGLPIDVNVQSMGDARSLAGGTLLMTLLYAPGDKETIYATAQGSVTLGGFDIQAGGNSSKKNFVTSGRIPAGGLVQRGAPTKVLYDGNRMFLDLEISDTTTADRIVAAIKQAYPELLATATNPGTIQLTLPQGRSEVQVMSQVEQLRVKVDSQGTIVVNERTGTIVMGGNVRIGPAVIAHGALSVRVDEQVLISQPNAFGQGSTVVAGQQTLNAEERDAQIKTIAPTTTVADLARIFQALNLKSADIISILQGLRSQGALKARLVVQ